MRRADGTVLTADCPEGVRRRRRRRFAVAGAAVAVLASLAGGVARALTGRAATRPAPQGELGVPAPPVMGAVSVAPPATDDEVAAAARQFVRRSGRSSRAPAASRTPRSGGRRSSPA